MNIDEQIKAELKELFSKANEGIESTSGFMQAQLPDVMEQLLLWKALHSSLAFLLGVGFLLFSFFWWQFCKRKEQLETDKDEIESWQMSRFMGSVISFVVGFMVTTMNLVWLQILVAPKFYLMEYTLRAF